MTPGTKAKGWTRSCGAGGAKPHPGGPGHIPWEQVQPGAAVGSSAAPASPTAQGTPVWGTLGCSPIPWCSNPWGHRGPPSHLPAAFGDPPARAAAPPAQPRGGGARQGVDLGRWGGSPWRQSAMTTVAMARLRGPARCHGDAPGTASRHGDGRGMERSPWLGDRAWDGMGGKGVSWGLNPLTLHSGASLVLPPTRCRLVPGAAAAARDHFHEAFPLQFTLPSDRPNFSFSE